MHELGPAVADGEQDDGERQAERDTGQQAPSDDRREDHDDDPVLEYGSVRRASTTHSTRKPSPMKSRSPPSSIRGMSDTSEAPNSSVASAIAAAVRPAGRRPEVEPDPVGQAAAQGAAEDQRRERARHDHLDDADHGAGGERGQRAFGAPLGFHPTLSVP